MSSAQKRFLDQNKQHINLSQSGRFFLPFRFRVEKGMAKLFLPFNIGTFIEFKCESPRAVKERHLMF
jgi:hypothetical protein